MKKIKKCWKSAKGHDRISAEPASRVTTVASVKNSDQSSPTSSLYGLQFYKTKVAHNVFFPARPEKVNHARYG